MMGGARLPPSMDPARRVIPGGGEADFVIARRRNPMSIRWSLCIWTAVSQGLCAAARASDPVGIYAVVDRVVLEPNAEAPERIQVWGVFALADRTTRQYEPAARGYLYFALSEKKADAARKEWSDLQRLAGDGECVALGGRYQPKPKVRRADEKPASPDPYPVGSGLTKMKGETEYPPVRAVRTVPAPVGPREGEEVKAGSVTLLARNMPEKGLKDAKYVFELKNDSGEKETSQELAAGEKETKWTPAMEVKPGVKYTWRVWVADGKWKGAAAEASFKGKTAS